MVPREKNRLVTATVSSLALATLTLAAHADPSWTLLATDGPSARWATSTVYDSCRGVTVLFGGYDVSGKLGDTWEWDCSGWTLRATTGPSPRVMNAMAFDENRCVVVLFGGVEEPGEVGDYLNDTWEWDGTSWTEKCQNCPPTTRNGAGMAYDSTRQVVLLFGGWRPSGLLNDTWEWNGTDWTQVSTTTPPSSRSDFAMAYDPIGDRTVVFGGSLQPVLCGTRSDETWELDMSTSPATWTEVPTSTQPSPRSSMQMVYDGARSVMVLFGGTEYCPSVNNFGDPWEYGGTTWSEIPTPTAPSPRHSYALTFDSVREEVLLFGGASSPESPVPTGEVLGDTWTYGVNLQPTCGDGVVCPGTEECDDGNTADGDCCSSTCELEPGCVSPPAECELGTVCDEHICKRTTYRTEDGDCLVEAGEKVDFETTIDVINNTDDSWSNTIVGDCFFSEVVVTNVHTQHGTFRQFQARSGKTCVRWKIGDLGSGESATLVVDAETGVDRRGRQEYTTCSNHSFNNGALLRFSDPHNQSFRTGPLVVSVLTPDAAGDCDGDGFSDQEELDAGSDPHDPDDVPE